MTKRQKRVLLKHRVECKIRDTFERLNHPIPHNLIISYGYSHANAGQYKVRENTLWFNLYVLDELTEPFIANTVPHEVCHVVAVAMSKTCMYSPHNSVWEGLMTYLGLDPCVKTPYTKGWIPPWSRARVKVTA